MISSKYEGGGSMFTNLKCSMLRAKIDAVDMAEILGISTQAIYQKLNGKSSWNLEQMNLVKNFINKKLNDNYYPLCAQL